MNSNFDYTSDDTLKHGNPPFSRTHPLVTVITVVYNGRAKIENTIKSVINQDYLNIEYIIIDGGSNDGTLEIIKKYKYAIKHFVSEKDNGIYDAMNKGINLASGDFINFMNCGDTFSDANTIKTVVNNLKPNIDLIYGDYHIKAGNNKRQKNNGKCTDLWKGLFCHQAMFMKTWIARREKFDTSISINADSDLVLKIISLGLICKKLDLSLACIEGGGLSDQSRLKSVLSQWRLTLKYRPKNLLIINIYFSALFIKNLVLVILRATKLLNR